MNRRLLVLVVCLGGLAGLWAWQSRPAAVPPGWQGYAEADYVKVGPTQLGRLTALHVARGDAVAAGGRLFDQDDTEEQAACDQARADLAEAAARLDNLQLPARDTEIAEAEADLAEARATLVRTARDRLRTRLLVPTGAASRQSLDQLQADTLVATARVTSAQAKLDQMRAPLGRMREIAAQRAVVDSARARLAQAEWRLGERHAAAPVAGRVADTYARPGETLAAGAPVVSLLAGENLFVRFFVPEPALAGLRLGAVVAVACDGCPSGLQAGISFIAPAAEYTPPVIYSDASRGKLAWLIEARPGGAAAALSPGQPVIVRPLAGAAP